MRAVVIGAGIVGAACARALAQQGLEVVVLERAAAVGGTSAKCEGNILVSDKTPGPELDLAVDAVNRWTQVARELADELGPQFPAVEHEPKGGVVVATTPVGAAALEEFAGTQRASSIDARLLTPVEAFKLEPHLNPDVCVAVHYPQDSQVQPVAAAEALLASARLASAKVLTDHEVIGVTRSNNGRIRSVRTHRREIDTDVIVNAAGPWAGAVADVLGTPLPVLPRRGMVLVTSRMPHKVFHKVYDADYVGATQSVDSDLQTSTVVESTAAGTVLIGSSRQRVGFDDRLDVRVIAEIAAKSLKIFPFLADMRVLRTYGGFRPYMPDHLPVIGQDPRTPGIFHVAGHEGAGIGLSVSSAELLRAEVTGSAPPVGLDPSAFSVGRASLADHLRAAA